MIRVVIRHIDEADGILLGDFPPSEIDVLLDRLKTSRVYFSNDYDNCKLVDDPLQWVQSDEVRPRMVLEVLLNS